MIWLEKRKEKRKLEQLLNTTKMESYKCYVIWSEMLYVESKITVLEANSEEELTQKWNDFHTPIDKGDGRLGSLWAIDDKLFTVNEGTFHLMIKYRLFSLREGVQKSDYEKTIAQYERIQKQVKELAAKVYGK